jgi:nucleoside-diphosphate-sugar epimerase
MNKVIITGATGFIGRQTIPFLKSLDFDIYAVTSKGKTEVRDDISWHSVDIFDYDRVADFCKEVGAANLLHLAWHDDPKERMTSPKNLDWVEASLHLTRAFTENGGERMILAGSCAEYDWRYGYCSEDITPTNPVSLYGECKASLNRIIEKYCRDQGTSYACGRIFFVYGPHDSEDRLIAYVIRSLLMGQSADISNGNQIRDYLHVKDVAGALVKLLRSDVEGPVNIGSGQPKTLRDIVDLVGRKLDNPELITYESNDGRRNENPVVIADITRLRDELRWSPTYDLDKGIEDTINWWKERQIETINT